MSVSRVRTKSWLYSAALTYSTRWCLGSRARWEAGGFYWCCRTSLVPIPTGSHSSAFTHKHGHHRHQ